MTHRTLVICAGLLAVALTLAGCARETVVEPSDPTTVKAIKDTDLNEIKLADIAFRNVGIQTVAVREATSSPTAAPATGTATATPASVVKAKRRLVIPQSALVFNPDGFPFVYTSPSPRTYVRSPVVVDRYVGTDILLISGPAVGTLVVTVGDPELLGIEYGVGAE